MAANVVHCNGYSLAEDPRIPPDRLECVSTEGTHRDWEYVCRGNPNVGALGRIPMTLWLARHVDANLIIWSTGSSRIVGGDYEATVFFKRALQSFAELKRDFPHRFGDDWESSETSYQRWIEAISITEIKSQRTCDSLIEARRIVVDRFGSKPVTLYSVTSANHAPRGAQGGAHCLRIWNTFPIALPKYDALRCSCRDVLRGRHYPGCASR